jgi:hypothetical protein
MRHFNVSLLGKRGKHFVIDHRSYENLSDKYIEVFSEID